MQNKLKKKMKKTLHNITKMLFMVSFIVSQTFMSEIFLYQNGIGNGLANVAKANANDPWYNTSYLQRKAITIDSTRVPNTDQSNFPVLVSLTDNDLKNSANGGDVQNGNGYDIVFTNQDGTSQLAHEIENYDGATGAINMWVKIPILSHTVNTVFYMYYDNSSITTSQENKTGVWDTNTKGVWHLKETGTNPAIYDSTSNANNSTSQTWTPSSGQIGGAGSFDGSSQFAVVADSSSLNPTDSLTYSLWVKPSANNTYIFDKAIGYGGYGLRMTSDNKFNLEVAGWSNVVPAQTLSTDSWQYVAVTFSDSNIYFYYNGTQYGPYARSASITSSGHPLVIGGKYTWESGEGYQPRPDFNGNIDELHISDTARSADWIATEYNNQSSPSTFYSVGSEENQTMLTVATPTFSVSSGTYSSSQSVTISTTTPDTAIYYTTDGSTPTTSSTQYTGAITVSTSETLKAIAVKDGYNNSEVGSAVYIINASIAYVTQTDNAVVYATGTSVQTSSINVAQGNLVAVFLAAYGNTGDMGITDSLGNTYTAAESAYTLSSSVTGQWFYTISQYSGSDTITGSFNGSFYTIRAIEYSGIDSISPVDSSAVVHASGSTAPAFSTSVANELVLAEYHIENAGGCTAGTGYTLLANDHCSEAVARPAEAQIFSDVQSGISAPVTANYGSQHIYGSWVVGFKGAYNPTPTVATPTFSPAEGTYASAQNVAISTTTPDATIYYTTNGSTPTTSSTLYTGTITVSESETLKAIAVKDGYNDSVVGSASYTINFPTVATPTFSPAAGTYASSQSVYIRTATVGDTIYYTTDGSTPTTSSTQYTGAITVSASETLKAIGVKSGYTDSAVGSASYIIGTSNAAASPTFSLTAGTYAVSQNVSLNTTTPDAAICYTTDGSNPTTDGAGTCTGNTQTYSTAISIPASLSIKAVAIKSGLDDSPLSNRAYVIGDNVITFHTSGRYFYPRIVVEGTPTILWTFDNGGAQESTQNSATPSEVDFGSAGNRITTLTVTPSSALVGIDIDYDPNADSGPTHKDEEYPIPTHHGSNYDSAANAYHNDLTAVEGLSNVAPWLQFWASSYDPITSIDFSNFESMQDIECLMCQQLTSINLENTPILTRLAVEASGLTNLDLSSSPHLKDLRSALVNDSTFAINWGDTGEDVWHICTHNDAMTTSAGQFPSFSQYPKLEQLWMYSDNQYGTIHPASTSLMSVWAQDNHYSSADFSGLFGAGQNAYVNIYNNQLTSLDVSDDPGLTYLDAHGNQLSTATVDTILQTMDSYNVTADSTTNNGYNGTSGNYYIDLTENGVPSSSGLSYATNLTNRGWTVLTAS